MYRADPSYDWHALVRDEIVGWQDGQPPNADRVLAAHPEIAHSKSLVLDLVLAEYRQRNRAGETVSRSEYFERFPDYRQSISRLLAVEDSLDRFPGFATADETLEWPLPGDEFLGYEIVEPLGIGGMAHVYLARELKVGQRLVVIKVSPFGGREADRLGKLSQPSIMPILSVTLDPAGVWTVICMPLLGVATAVDLLDRAFARGGVPKNGRLVAEVAHQTRPLAPIPEPGRIADDPHWDGPYADAIARLGLQLAEGLAAAHAAGILHRDIKPSNILLGWSGQPVLLDFNLATDDQPAAQRVGGTPAYMAPERIASVLAKDKAAAGRFQPQCDLYSLGVVFYELLSGRLPATPSDGSQSPSHSLPLWLECKRQPVLPPGASGLPVDRKLAAIMLKCLALDPAERYAAASEVAADLRAYLSNRAQPRGVFVRRRRELLLGAIGLAATGISATAYWTTRPPPLQAYYEQALAEYKRGHYEAAATSFSRCLQIEPGWSPALFGRGQAYRMLERWGPAQQDFRALQGDDEGWGYAFAGYCALRENMRSEAHAYYINAYKAGIRDPGVLINYARLLRLGNNILQVIEVCTELLRVDPENRHALANRALAYASYAFTTKVVAPQAFEDVRAFRRLEPTSFLPAFISAIVYGSATHYASEYQDEAIAWLTVALRRGMPRKLITNYQFALRPLVLHIDADVLEAANTDQHYPYDPFPIQHPPVTADWSRIRRETSQSSPQLARAR